MQGEAGERVVSGSMDIRAWAREKGYPVGEKGRIAREIHDDYELYLASQNGGAVDEEPFVAVPSDVPPEAAPRDEERPPAVPPAGKLLGRRGRAPRKPARPYDVKTRVSAAGIFSFAWGGLSYALSRNPMLIPTARAVDMQAPYAGEVLDDLVKGTIVDRLVQPLARGGDKAEVVFGLAGFPACVAMVSYHPEWMPTLRPVMKMALMASMEAGEPAMKRMQKRMERFEEKLGGADLDGMIDAIFADINVGGVPSSAEEANVRRARGDQPPA
jgi:hypothetical protein